MELHRTEEEDVSGIRYTHTHTLTYAFGFFYSGVVDSETNTEYHRHHSLRLVALLSMEKNSTRTSTGAGSAGHFWVTCPSESYLDSE